MTNPRSVDSDMKDSGAAGEEVALEATPASQLGRLARLTAALAEASQVLITEAGERGCAQLAAFGDLAAGIDRDAISAMSDIQAVTTAKGGPPRTAPTAVFVEDVQRDTRFVQIPWVRNHPQLRFVAKLPVVDREGRALASLWILDDRPRTISTDTKAALADLAALIADALCGPTSDVDRVSGALATTRQGEMIHAVLNALFVFVGILDLEGTLLDANDPPLKAANLVMDDVRGKPFWECYWWSFSQSAQAHLRDAIARTRCGEVVRFDAKVRLADNRFITIDFLLAPLFDHAGRITHLIASGVDITRRERAEAELRRVARIVEESPFLIRSATPDGRVLYLNRYGREALGYTPDGDLANAEVSHHHPDWAMQLLRVEGYPGARKHGQWLGETAIIDTDGREVPTSHAIVAHRNGDGNVEYFSSIAIDISGEKAAQAALRESELRFRGTFENAAVGIAHVNVEGRWLRVNERLLDIVGYARAELVQMTFQDITHPEDLQRDLELFEKLKAGQIDSYSLDKRYYRNDGTVIWVEITVSMQEKSGGAEPYVIAIVEDITERKQAEQRQRLLLSELNHRVKNTLATIQSIANQTLRRSSDPRSFVARFNGRLQSLSGAHDLLTAQTWEGADLATLLRTQVGLNGTIDARRIKLSGPSVLLPPQVALNLALIIHELAINALQYGAFANDAGRVEVAWTVAASPAADDMQVKIVWTEQGGLPVGAPHHHGFGTVILERGLKLGLGGMYDMEWKPTGLVARLDVPLPLAAFRKNLFET